MKAGTREGFWISKSPNPPRLPAFMFNLSAGYFLFGWGVIRR